MDERSNPSYPIPADRMENVLGYIQEHGSVQIKELARQFHVSESTIRRDLDELALKGLLQRTHGGAPTTSTWRPMWSLTHRLRWC